MSNTSGIMIPLLFVKRHKTRKERDGESHCERRRVGQYGFGLLCQVLQLRMQHSAIKRLLGIAFYLGNLTLLVFSSFVFLLKTSKWN